VFQPRSAGDLAKPARSRQSIKPCDQENIAGAKRSYCLTQLLAIGLGPANLFSEDLPGTGCDPCRVLSFHNTACGVHHSAILHEAFLSTSLHPGGRWVISF
jgi:hypothetical protein